MIYLTSEAIKAIGRPLKDTLALHGQSLSITQCYELIARITTRHKSLAALQASGVAQLIPANVTPANVLEKAKALGLDWPSTAQDLSLLVLILLDDGLWLTRHEPEDWWEDGEEDTVENAIDKDGETWIYLSGTERVGVFFSSEAVDAQRKTVAAEVVLVRQTRDPLKISYNLTPQGYLVGTLPISHAWRDAEHHQVNLKPPFQLVEADCPTSQWAEQLEVLNREIDGWRLGL